jgi:hypothetical protein
MTKVTPLQRGRSHQTAHEKQSEKHENGYRRINFAVFRTYRQYIRQPRLGVHWESFVGSKSRRGISQL